MTVTVGFLCSDGIVLGADTQESQQGSILKRNVPKLIVAPPIPTIYDRLNQPEKPDRRGVFTGAGDGPLIDKLVNEIWTEVSIAPPSVTDMGSEAEAAIKRLYREYRQIYHAEHMPHAELLYGLWCNGETKLFHAFGAIVNSIGTMFGAALVGYKATGLGSEITDYIAGRMYDKNFKVHEAAILAMYMLQQAIDHAEGCGGEANIAVIRNDGTVENMEASKSLTTKLLMELDSRFGSLMVSAADAEFKESLLDVVWAYLRKYITAYRSGRKNIEATVLEHERELAELLKKRT